MRFLVPGLLAAALAAVAAVSFFLPSGPRAAVGGVALAVGHLSAGVLMYRRSKMLDRRDRRPWRFIAVALMVSVAGLMIVAAMGDAAPVVGPADAFFITSYALLIVGLGLIAAMDPEGPPWGLTMLDVSVGAVAAVAIVWDVVLRDLGTADVSSATKIGLAIYPILDVAVVVGLFLVALRRSHFRFDARLILVGSGMIVQVIADMTYLRSGLHAETFGEAQPVIALWLVTSALYVLAASIVDRVPKRQDFPERDVPLWATVGPYALAAALVPIHVVRINLLYDTIQVAMPDVAATDERIVLDSLLIVGVLVVIRQVVAIWNNRTRVEQQRRDLIASVSHELRTPLTAIMGFLHVLEEDPKAFTDTERDSMMSEVTGQARHISRTVTDLIALARDGGASMAIRREPQHLTSIIHAAMKAELSETAATTDVTDAMVLVDADRIEQAVGHLLANARKYSAGNIHVSARLRVQSLLIEVHDDGPGVPTRHVSSVWNQFERGGRRLDSTNPGLGIGLAIVKAIAVAHDGTAGYRRSGILGGSCFTLTIPAAAAPVRDSRRAGVGT